MRAKEITKNRWTLLVTDSERQAWSGDLIDLVKNAYQHTNLGSFITNVGEVQSSDWVALDWDSEPDVDCTVFYRRPRQGEQWTGYKIQGIGHDGHPESKKRVLHRVKVLLSKKGNWIESSDALARTLGRLGLQPVTDEKILHSLFPNSELRIENNGTYKRMAGGQWITEQVFGNPVVSDTLEEGWRDWVAGGAMALGALGAHGDAEAATKHGVNRPAITQQAKVPSKQAMKPGKVAQKIQAVAQPKKMSPEESRQGLTPEELKAYIQACAERYLPREEIARFMGEVAHETANFTSMVEKNPEKNIKHYGKRGNPLGNSDMNDAWKYIGRGYLQITGKYNYKHFGDKIRQGLGDELLANPNLALRKDVAAALAVVYWRERVAPKMAAGASSKEIARAINGKKPKGLKSREEKTKQISQAMGNRRV
jgi:predicted chitinase